MQTEPITIRSGNITATLCGDRVSRLISSEPHSQSVVEQCRNALLFPRGLPELTRCVVPGDNIAIVIDPETPNAVELLGVICEQLQSVYDSGITVTLLLPPDPAHTGWASLLEQLPLHLRQVSVHVHDPEATDQLSYLANSASGERVYLNRRVSDADLLVTIGMVCFDSLLGYRGTTSGIFPAFSDAHTIEQARSQGHPELTPDQPRPYRQLIDEVGWLLGTQFSVQVVPGPGDSPLAVLVGLPEEVMAAGKEIVNSAWRVKSCQEVDAVVLSVPCAVSFGWKQFGKAIELATKLVQPDGRIIVVADLPVPEGPGATLLRRCHDPDELLKPLRREQGEDSVEVSQLIHALRFSRVYLYSNIPTNIVEELGMIAIEDEAELQRLTSAAESCVALPNANYAWIA